MEDSDRKSKKWMDKQNPGQAIRFQGRRRAYFIAPESTMGGIGQYKLSFYGEVQGQGKHL